MHRNGLDVEPRRYGQDETVALIHAQEQACQDWLDELQTNLAVLTPGQLDEWIVVTYRIERLISVLAWLKICAAELERTVSQG